MKLRLLWLRVKNTYERVVYGLIRDIYIQKMLLGIITYTFLSDLKKFLRIVGQMLIALVYENPELFHLIGVLSVLSVLGIFSVVLLIVNIYKISRRLVDFFFC
jgi:TctA family transporter